MRITAYAVMEKGGKPERFSYDRALATRDVLVRITHRSITRGSAEHRIGAIVDVMPFSRMDEAIERVRRRDVLGGLVLESLE